MLLWSIQHLGAYEELLKTGTLRANEEYMICPDVFLKPYEWIAAQMNKRIGPPPKGVRFPIWAFYQWEGQRKRLDMRTHRRWGKAGTPIVLLTIDVPDELVLLSNFDMWHCVLNQSLCPIAEEDDIEEPTQEEIENSWNNIFSIDADAPYWDTPKTTQATFWELRREWVIKAEHFVSA